MVPKRKVHRTSTKKKGNENEFNKEDVKNNYTSATKYKVSKKPKESSIEEWGFLKSALKELKNELNTLKQNYFLYLRIVPDFVMFEGVRCKRNSEDVCNLQIS